MSFLTRFVAGLLTAVTGWLGVPAVASPAGSETPSAPAVNRPGTAEWYLRTSLTTGPAETSLVYGRVGDVTVMGDWDGDGDVTVGVVRGDRWLLRNSNTSGAADIEFRFPRIDGQIPVVGDWDGDQTDTAGYVENSDETECVDGENFGYCGPARSAWTLRDSNDAASTTEMVNFAHGGDPVVGDWNGDQVDDIGVVAEARWLIMLDRSGGTSDYEFQYGRRGDLFAVGDWDGDGTDEPAVVRGNRWLARRDSPPGPAQIAFHFGRPSDMPLVWAQ